MPQPQEVPAEQLPALRAALTAQAEDRGPNWQPQARPVDESFARPRTELAQPDAGDTPPPATEEQAGFLDPAEIEALARSLQPQQPPVPPQQEGPSAQQTQKFVIPAPFALAMIDHGLAGQEQFIMQLGVPLPAIVDFHISRAAALVASIENPVARGHMVQNMLTRFGALVDQLYLQQRTTPGGLLIPPAGAQVPRVHGQ